LRKIDTTNRFVNNVTKKNDSTITVFKGSTSTDIVLPRGGGTALGDTVYTISPIMSITRNDSNIVYFNEDTANIWRGGGVSISQGYGITNTPNPITSTGTIIADTSVSGLSGKYLRLTDTATMLNPYPRGSGAATTVAFWNGSRSLTNNTNLFIDNTAPTTPSLFVSNGTPQRSVMYSNYNGIQYNSTNYAYSTLSGSTPYFVAHNEASTNREARYYSNQIQFNNLTTSGYVNINAPSTYSNTSVNFPDSNGTLALKEYTIAKDANNNIAANAFLDGFTNTAASGTLITLTVASTPNFVITGSGGQTIKMPDATTLRKGATFSFNNNQSSGAISINNNSNTLIVSIPSGAYTIITLLDSTTTAGSWDYHDQAPSNVSWSTNTFNVPASITGATWNGTTVTYNRGGTGQSSLFTQGGVAFGSTTTALGTTAVGTAGQVLTSAGTGTPTWTTLAANDTTTYYLLSDFTTSSTTAANTNLTFNLGANEVRRIMINGTCSKVGTTGLKLAIGAPTGATIKATQNSSSNAISTSAISVISAINTLGGTINTATGVEMPFRIEGVITNSTTAGAVTLQVATVTSGAVTIYAGTILSVGKVKGL
jgi:hypothetical protein